MALERLTLAPAALDADNLVPNGGDDGNKAPRLPRWTRQEILVLIQGKRVAENRVRRGRTAGLAFGSGQVEPKWASVSSYCKRHGVNRGPVQCRKRWSNLAGDFKKIKEWESQIKEEAESFWVMRNDLRREKKLPGFFDREVYDILDGGGPSEDAADKSLALALAPTAAREQVDADVEPEPETETETEVVFDSGRTDEGLFSDFEPSGQDRSPEKEREREKEKEAPTVSAPAPAPAPAPVPVPISEKRYEPIVQGTPHSAQGTPQATPTSETHQGRKRKRFTTDANEDDDEDISLHNQLIKAMERNSRLLSSQLEVQSTNFQLDREQRKDHANSLFAVLNKLADAMVRIADKL